MIKPNVGDYIVSGDGCKSLVLEVLENTFLKSVFSDYDETDCWFTFQEIDKHGWKIERKKEKWVPKFGELYYLANTASHEMFSDCCWNNYKNDFARLERGIVFKTKEEAIEASKKMLKALED